MSGAVRRSLAAVDGHRHVALAAFAGAEPVGIVRIIGQDHCRAELAVEVVDAWQGRGVGTRLLAAARDRAAQLGHCALVAEVLAENTAMRAVLRRVFPTARTRSDGAELTITLPVAVDKPTDRRHAHPGVERGQRSGQRSGRRRLRPDHDTEAPRHGGRLPA